ncbi:MAG: TrmH family RNA methyltransferase [Saccharofermentanales bacterium]
MKQIMSKSNPKFKELLSIRGNCGKDRDASVFIEGERLCKEAYISGVVFKEIIIAESYLPHFIAADFPDSAEIITLDDRLFQKLCSTSNPQGIAAIVQSPVIGDFDGLSVDDADKYIICESIQDPGNLGSIIRTADAFGFCGVIMTSDSVDPFNEKVLRSSMGSVFHIRIVCSKSIDEIFSWAGINKVTTYAAHLNGDDLTKDMVFKYPCAIVVGNEGKGLTYEMTGKCDNIVRIPMKGKAESLNVSVASAILCYLMSIQ